MTTWRPISRHTSYEWRLNGGWGFVAGRSRDFPRPGLLGARLAVPEGHQAPAGRSALEAV